MWERFAETSAELVQLVEEKYSTDRRAQALLDRSIRQAIERRQLAKQEILAHERERHSKATDCAVCDGTGKMRREGSRMLEYLVCAHCHGSGVTRFNDTTAE